MGVLGAAGAIGIDTTAPEPDMTAMDDAPITEPAAEPPSPPPDRGEFVPQSAIDGKTPGSRRQRAEEKIAAEVEKRFKAFEDDTRRRESEYQQTMRQYVEKIGALQGELSAIRQMPQQPAQQQETPEILARRARDYLAEGKMDEYHETIFKASTLASEQRFNAKLDEIRRAIPQPVNPALQAMVLQHKNVAMAGERGMRAVLLKEQELDLYSGMPPGPARVQKAFELADAALAGQHTSQPVQFSRESAGALSGVAPATPSRQSNSEPGVHLNEIEAEVARNARMTPAEYVRWKNPQKYGLIK